MLVAIRQSTAAACSRAVLPKARDFHASVAAVMAVHASLPRTSSAASRGMSTGPARHRTTPSACACHAGRADSEAR